MLRAFMTAALLFVATDASAGDLSSCSFNGIDLKGDFKVVDSFPDIKVQIVDSFADVHVKMVDSFPDKCGLWKEVDSFPDFKVQYVDSFPDIKIKLVDSFPGLQ